MDRTMQELQHIDLHNHARITAYRIFDFGAVHLL